MSKFVEKLIENSESDMYPMHMPGHKRRTLKFEPDDTLSQIRAIDISEIQGFDDLNRPEGIIRELEERAERVFGSEHSMLLVNGSTGGILAAISACVKRGGRLLMARNCHRSVYNAANICGLQTSYIYPDVVEGVGINGGISPAAVMNAMAEHPDAQAVVITSPTYEGVVSDIEVIAEVVHGSGLPLIVDEAHGGHFCLHERFGEKYGMVSAIRKGADIVIQSLHKTLPSYTQTAILHYSSSLIDADRLRRYVSSYQTSSPSYILMAGIDRCLDILDRSHVRLFEEYEKNLEKFYSDARELQHLHLLDPRDIMYKNSVAGFDAGKLVIMAPRGKGLFDTLIREFGIHAEMYGSNYVVAMTSIMDNPEAFDILLTSLKKCDIMLDEDFSEEVSGINPAINSLRPRAVMSITDALEDREPDKGSCDPTMVCRNFIYAYPPGVPVMVPGELFSEEILELLDRLGDTGVEMRYQ